MTIELLTAIGLALYGTRWQSDLARDLKVSERVIRRWLAEPDNIPIGVKGELLVLCRANLTALEVAIESLDAL